MHGGFEEFVLYDFYLYTASKYIIVTYLLSLVNGTQLRIMHTLSTVDNHFPHLLGRNKYKYTIF